MGRPNQSSEKGEWGTHPSLTIVLWGSHPPLSFKNLESSGMNWVSSVPQYSKSTKLNAIAKNKECSSLSAFLQKPQAVCNWPLFKSCDLDFEDSSSVRFEGKKGRRLVTKLQDKWSGSYRDSRIRITWLVIRIIKWLCSDQVTLPISGSLSDSKDQDHLVTHRIRITY